MIRRLEAFFEGMKRFTADASHELRGPLARMRGAIDVVLARPRRIHAPSDAYRGSTTKPAAAASFLTSVRHFQRR